MNGKRIVLTGASSGIGYELCRVLCEENRIFASARRAEKIFKHDNVTAYACDISRPENIDRLLDDAKNEMGDIDIFIANAGFAYYECFDTPDWDHISSIFNTNVFSVIYTLSKLRKIKNGGDFTFAVTASAMCHLAMPGYSLYSATKFALKGFTDAFRFELPKNQNICMIYPIATLTSFFDAAGTQNLPWPRQKADYVAKQIVKGVSRNRKHIYPSKLYRIMLFLNRFLPILKIYLAMENKKTQKALCSGDK